MLYRTVPKTGDRLSVLGFGCMRLPLTRSGGIDEARAIRQIRSAIDRGVNYLDTAPAYHLGRSEAVVARALEDGYRKKVRIATKLPPWSVRSRRDMDRILDAQLARLGTGSIDYYLVHSLSGPSWERMRDLGVREFLTRAKEDGRITNAGFSFHGDPAAFRTIVDAFDWEFCQIQYNYLDERTQAGTEGLRYAAGKDLAIMVMEPIRGGNLAGQIPREVQAIWDRAPVRRSPAEWALRWVWNHTEVTVALSGMNQESQIDENIRIAGEALPDSLLPDESALIARVSEAYRRLMKVPCTGCGYCMPCPHGVDIPGCFSLFNAHHLFPADRSAKFHYLGRHGGLLSPQSHAGLCRRCGACERICPQQIPIPDRLREVDARLGGMMRVTVPVLKGGLWCMDRITGLMLTVQRRPPQ